MSCISISIIKILSFSILILKFFKPTDKIIYIILEPGTIKLGNKKLHLMCNETCFSNDILIIYKNVIKVVTRKKNFAKINLLQKDVSRTLSANEYNFNMT